MAVIIPNRTLPNMCLTCPCYKDLWSTCTEGISVGDGFGRPEDCPLKSAENVVIIPDNATNGDVLKTMFPIEEDWEVTQYRDVSGHYVRFKNLHEIKTFPLAWWNAPYKSEIEPQNREVEDGKID